VPKEEVELKFSIGWIVLGTARGKSFAISRQHHGIDGKEHLNVARKRHQV